MTVKTIQVCDRSTIRATRTEEGFLVDTPVVGRIGIQDYLQDDGTKLRVLRPPEEVFARESLDSMQGKPITYGHVFVNSKNAKHTVIGSTASAGFPDGIYVRTRVAIFVGDVIESVLLGDAQELSLGYVAEYHETPGWWNDTTQEIIWCDEVTPELPTELNTADWHEFHVVQRKIRINHLAVVKRARAGRNARLNIDEDDMTIVKYKIGDAEFEIPVAVKDQIDALNDALKDEKSKKTSDQAVVDGLKAKVDQLQAVVDGFDQRTEQMKQKWLTENKIRAELEVAAKPFGVACDGMTNKEVKLEMLRRAGAGDMSDKSESYIDAAFDLRKGMFSADALAYGVGDSLGGPMYQASGIDPIDAAYLKSISDTQE